MQWSTEWVAEVVGALSLRGGAPAKHTVVIFFFFFTNRCKRSSPLQLFFFQPKIATIEDIAIALVKMSVLADWRNLRDS